MGSLASRLVAAAPASRAAEAVAQASRDWRATGRKRSSTLTTLMTPAAKARVKQMVASEGLSGRTSTRAPPRKVALPAMKALRTGW
jgi:hypothetical protein